MLHFNLTTFHSKDLEMLRKIYIRKRNINIIFLIRPATHLRSKVILSVMNDQVTMSIQQIPPELGRVITLTGDRKTYLPIIYVDELTMRMRDLRIVNSTDSVSDIEIVYRPISFGRLRLFLQFYTALSSMHQMGFTEKDTDEVKGIFADTNLALLLVTFGVSAIHLLFDFLAFKNDVNFWRGKKTVEGKLLIGKTNTYIVLSILEKLCFLSHLIQKSKAKFGSQSVDFFRPKSVFTMLQKE